MPFYGMLRMFAAAVGLASGLTLAQSAPFMLVGNDEKLLWDDQFKPLLSPPGRDSVPIVDLADPVPARVSAVREQCRPCRPRRRGGVRIQTLCTTTRSSAGHRDTAGTV